jgi:hypothetical protein
VAQVELHKPGDPQPEVSVGDVILTHSAFWTGKMIRFGQRLRWRGARRPFANFNHAVLVVDGSGAIVEALGHGVEHNMLGKYRDTEYALIRTDVHPVDAGQMLDFAESVLAARTKYGYLEILSLGLTLAIPAPIQFGAPGTMICSGFVASALTRAGIVWSVTPEYAMPADIAEHFGVTAA